MPYATVWQTDEAAVMNSAIHAIMGKQSWLITEER